MQTLEEREAALDDRIQRLRRARRVQIIYTLAAGALGVGIGFALAEALIDPVTVVTTGCGGIRA